MRQILVYADSLSWGMFACAFFDAASVTPASRVDGIHLDADQHRALGEALAGPVGRMLG